MLRIPTPPYGINCHVAPDAILFSKLFATFLRSIFDLPSSTFHPTLPTQPPHPITKVMGSILLLAHTH